MRKTHSLRVYSLYNEAHCDFMTNYLVDLIETAPAAVKQALEPILPAFAAAVEHELAWEDWSKASSLTKDIRDADRERDRTLRAIKLQINASMLSVHPDITEAARRLKDLFAQYGYIPNKGYEAESAAAASLLRHLQTDRNADAVKAGLKSWISILESDLAHFNELYNLRNRERSQKPSGSYRSARHDSDDAYKLIVAVLDIGASGPNPAPFVLVINELNEEIDRLNAKFSPPAKFDMSACEPDRIPDQVETGDPLTPCVPAVYYPFDEESLNVRIEEHSIRNPETDRVKVDEHGIITRMERLILGRDYSLSYRNNIKPGTAIATIHGKGRFKGKYEEAFTILPYGSDVSGDEGNCSCGSCNRCLERSRTAG